MSRARRLSHVATIGVITGLLLTAFLPSAHAGPGDPLLPPVTIDPLAQCLNGAVLEPGTAMALVQGSKINPSFPTIPVLVVTSCHTVNPGVLHFLDTAGVRKATITTTFVPTNGWGALAVRADKGDLLACANRNGNDQHEIYTIKYNGFVASPADGTATLLFAAPANGISVCDGLAWDQSTDSIYKTNKAIQPDLSIAITSISRFDKNGAPLGTLPGFDPTGCGDSGGITLAGGGLLLHCSGDLSVHHLDKLTGVESTTVLTPFTPTVTAATDVECDPVTFASGHKDALWTKEAVSSQLVPMELPGGTCGFHDGPLVFAPGACLLGGVQDLTNVTDTDGDGLLDCWEDGAVWAAVDGKPGIDYDGDGLRDLILCDTPSCASSSQTASKTQKDVFVEIDYMKDHLPDASARTNVVTAFNNAPGGPIRLHLQLGEEVPHTNGLALEPCTDAALQGDTDFEQLKRDKFGTLAERTQGAKTIYAKRLAFHYAVFAHKLTPSATNNSSGCSQIGGADIAVTLGGFASTLVNNVIHNRGTTDQQAGTFMHELGHNLGFRHGGSDNVNCKPNYLSVLNYSRQFPNIIAGRRLDYSRNGPGSGAITLIEAVPPGLTEAAGIGAGPFPIGEKTAFGLPSGSAKVVSVAGQNGAGIGVNWDQDNNTTDTGLNLDINRIDAAGCTADGAGSTLAPFNDWANAQFNLRASLEFAGGGDTEQTDTTADQEEAGFASVDSDGNGPDALQCGAPAPGAVVSCILDVKEGDPLNITNLVSPLQGVLPAALMGSSTFDPTTQVDVSTLRLDGHPVAMNNQGKFQCGTGDVNRDGWKDLNCKYENMSFPTPGSYFAILEGNLLPAFGGWAIRARDIVNVKP
jgi:hypothetical protein